MPLGENSFVTRPYGFNEQFKYVDAGEEDAFKVKAFPVVDDVEELGKAVNKILGCENIIGLYPMVSAEEILNKANLKRLFEQRKSYHDGV